MTISVTGDRDFRELSEYADKVVRTQIERASGVGEVEMQGEHIRTINIWIDADRLEVSAADVSYLDFAETAEEACRIIIDKTRGVTVEAL